MINAVSPQNLSMMSSVTGFVVGHYAVSGKLSEAHINFYPNEVQDNICITEAQGHYDSGKVECKEISRSAFTWLLKNFSHEGDTVVAVNSINALVAALATGRDCIGVVNGDVSARDVIRSVLDAISSSGNMGTGSL